VNINTVIRFTNLYINTIKLRHFLFFQCYASFIAIYFDKKSLTSMGSESQAACLFIFHITYRRKNSFLSSKLP